MSGVTVEAILLLMQKLVSEYRIVCFWFLLVAVAYVIMRITKYFDPRKNPFIYMTKTWKKLTTENLDDYKPYYKKKVKVNSNYVHKKLKKSGKSKFKTISESIKADAPPSPSSSTASSRCTSPPPTNCISALPMNHLDAKNVDKNMKQEETESVEKNARKGELRDLTEEEEKKYSVEKKIDKEGRKVVNNNNEEQTKTKMATEVNVAQKCINEIEDVKTNKFNSVGDENKYEKLNEGIASLYDDSTYAWEKLWGDHLHHGYYPDGEFHNDHRQAQIDMIEKSLQFIFSRKNPKIKNMLDVGCGLGGSSRYICKKYGCQTTGITLSSYQKKRAEEISAEEHLFKKTKFLVCDALKMPFPENSFDFVYSMESAEHIPHKKFLLEQLIKVCKPGGRIGIITWCHRNLENGENSLTPSESNLLDKICRSYYLPTWWSSKDYMDCLKKFDLEDVRCQDWTLNVKPFWWQVIKSAMHPRGIYYLLRSSLKTFKGLLASFYMIKGYRSNLIRFIIITAQKKA